jgi:signal transduction histidine kinase
MDMVKIKELIGRWEAFLRLGRLTQASSLFKARIVYVTAIAFIAVQLINGLQMFIVYDGWILDHTLLLLAILLVAGSTLTLRRHANFDLFSVLWGVTILVGVGGTALPAQVGINSALLPFLVMGVVIVAMLGTWRSLALYCCSAILLTFTMHLNAANADFSVLSDPDYVALRNTQRTMQTLFAIIMVGIVMGLLSVSMRRLFDSLQNNLAKARSAEAAKSQFLADMSHELRTPLNGVLGMNQLLKRSDLDRTQRDYVEIIEDCGVGMITVIDDILDLSRLEEGRITLKPTAFDPARMLESVIALHQANASSKGLDLTLTVEPGLPKLFRGDHGRLRQVAGNLISNAVKFTDTGYVAVALRGRDLGEGQWWLNIFVQDTGVGITPQRQARIFERFEQAEDGQTNTVRGSGLGLAICRELTDLFGGEISVRSMPGQGSLFCVAIPMPAVADETEQNPTMDAPSARERAIS